jgi:hypothetical protein
MMKRAGWWVVALCAACGETAVTPPLDASRDVTVDAAADVAAEAAVCDVGPAPTAMLPTLRGVTRILDADGGMFPTPSGGDPAGRWVMTAATLYFPAQARGLVVPETSTLSGTGWATIEGSDYRISTSLELALDTTSVGPVRRPAGTTSRGTFVQRGNDLALSPVCASVQGGDGSGSVMQMVGFSRDSMDRGRLFATLMGAAGRAVIVFDLERVP